MGSHVDSGELHGRNTEFRVRVVLKVLVKRGPRGIQFILGDEQRKGNLIQGHLGGQAFSATTNTRCTCNPNCIQFHTTGVIKGETRSVDYGTCFILMHIEPGKGHVT